MPSPVIAAAIRGGSRFLLRALLRAVAARATEETRNAHPASTWVFGGVAALVAAPAALALLVGITLQALIFPSLLQGVQGLEEPTDGWVRRSEIESGDLLATAPTEWIWPVEGPITVGYGGCSFAMCPHWGIDIAASGGTPVRAAADGIVAEIGWDPDGYGHYVILAHGGRLSTLYAHLRESADSGLGLSTGAEVIRGRTVGFVGSSGASTGPHLHFEIRDGAQSADPRVLLPN